MNVGLSQRKNRFKTIYPDFAYNHFIPATSEGYTGFLLQRQLNPAKLICKLALVDSLQVLEIIAVYPKLTVIKRKALEKALQPLCHYAVAITKATLNICVIASKLFGAYHR